MPAAVTVDWSGALPGDRTAAREGLGKEKRVNCLLLMKVIKYLNQIYPKELLVSKVIYFFYKSEDQLYVSPRSNFIFYIGNSSNS